MNTPNATNSSGLDDNKITREEFRNIVKSLDKKEFENYMGDYIKEISNPDNVAEQNQFLKNAEENKDLPQNVKLAQPKRGFCIKSEKFSIKRPGIRQKVYINICQLDEIKPPLEDETNKGMWSLPHMINKGRNDQDKKGDLCTTYDIVFNPKAIQMSQQYPQFKKFVCESSIIALNNNLLKSQQEKISNDYVVKSKFDYKGKEVSIMNVHSLYKTELDSRKEPTENFKSNIQKEIEEKKNNNEVNDDEENVFDKPDMCVESSEKEVQELELKKFSENSGSSANITPKYIFKYSTGFELHKHFYLPSNVEEKNSEKLIVEIEVPKLDNLSQAELELDKKKLHFRYKDIYLLDIDLPSEIDKDKSDAKFDRKKNLLTISANTVRKSIDKTHMKEDENVEIVKEYEEEEEKPKEDDKNSVKEEKEVINRTEQEQCDRSISNSNQEEASNKSHVELNLNRSQQLEQTEISIIKSNQRVNNQDKEIKDNQELSKQTNEDNFEIKIIISSKLLMVVVVD